MQYANSVVCVFVFLGHEVLVVLAQSECIYQNILSGLGMLQ